MTCCALVVIRHFVEAEEVGGSDEVLFVIGCGVTQYSESHQIVETFCLH